MTIKSALPPNGGDLEQIKRELMTGAAAPASKREQFARQSVRGNVDQTDVLCRLAMI
ncbi:MAG: hypothetical protein ABL904_13405 [Hyphomicrobiaceae bacterium]